MSINYTSYNSIQYIFNSLLMTYGFQIHYWFNWRRTDSQLHSHSTYPFTFAIVCEHFCRIRVILTIFVCISTTFRVCSNWKFLFISFFSSSCTHWIVSRSSARWPNRFVNGKFVCGWHTLTRKMRSQKRAHALKHSRLIHIATQTHLIIAHVLDEEIRSD